MTRLELAIGGATLLAVGIAMGAMATTALGADAPSITIAGATVTEGDAGDTTELHFPITLSAAAAGDVTVTVLTADGSATAPADYTDTLAELVIPAGHTSATAIVPVTPDNLDEANETLTVALLTGDDVEPDGTTAVGFIVDDEGLPAVSIGDATVAEGASGARDAVFAVTLDVASTETVTAAYATRAVAGEGDTATSGADFQAKTGTVTFAPGELSKPISITVLHDNVANEPAETFRVLLSSPNGAAIGDGTGVGTITPRQRQLTVADVSAVESAAQVTFTLALDEPASDDVRVTYEATPGTAKSPADFTASSGTVDIPTGQSSVTIDVPLIGDTLDELNETFTLWVGVESGNASVGDASAVATIVDDDPTPTASVDDLVVTEGTGGTKNAVVTVRLSAASGRNTRVTLSTANGTAVAGQDYTAVGGTQLIIAAGTTTKTLNIPLVTDALDEADETFLLNLSSPVSCTIGDGQGVVTITDDD